MKLIYPNPCRSFDARSSCVCFWGYDRTIEISFFVGINELKRLCPDMGDADTGFLRGVGLLDLLPVQRGNATLSNPQVFTAILYVAEHGCKWRGLPKKFGNWHSIYTRANRWAKYGVLDRVFAALQESNIINIQVDHVSLDSTAVEVHPDGTGALKKAVNNLSVSHGPDGGPKYIGLQPTLEPQ
jgi:transposase